MSASNSHNFNSFIKLRRYITLTISTIVLKLGFYVDIIQIFSINAWASLISKPNLSLILKSIKFKINNSLLKLLHLTVVTIKFYKISIISIMSQVVSIINSTLKLKKILITAVIQLIWRWESLFIYIPKFIINANPIVSQFQKLYTFDPQRLNQLDSRTIGSMDSITAP